MWDSTSQKLVIPASDSQNVSLTARELFQAFLAKSKTSGTSRDKYERTIHATTTAKAAATTINSKGNLSSPVLKTCSLAAIATSKPMIIG